LRFLSGAFSFFLRVIFDLLFFVGFLFGYAQARCEPNLRVVENAGRPYESL
jgi:hypothetical protein